MASASTFELAQKLYIAYYQRPADPEGLRFWADRIEASGGDLTDALNEFGLSDEAAGLYGEITEDNIGDVVDAIFLGAFGRVADAGGKQFYVDGFIAGDFTPSSIALDVINGATGADLVVINNKVSAADKFTDAVDGGARDDEYGQRSPTVTYDEDDIAAARAWLGDVTDLPSTVPSGAEAAAFVQGTIGDGEEGGGSGDGRTFVLTASTDRGAEFTGTDGGDEFEAPLSQNQFAGGVSNSLSSADVLNGGAGQDSLMAQIVNEFVGATSDTQSAIDIQPTTTNIETIEFEARELGEDVVGADGGDGGDGGDGENGGDGGDGADGIIETVGLPLVVDAKDIQGHDRIGSWESDGDLVIENLTTIDSSGFARNTSDLTVSMKYTDNFNSDDDASDLTVYFDEDYLLSGETTQGASLTVRLINAVENEAGGNPVEKFNSIVFSVGGTDVTVDITDIAADGTLDFNTAYGEVVDAINDQLTADGFTTVTAALAPIENAVFSINVAGFTPGDPAGQFFPITITNTGPEELAGVTVGTAEDASDTDLNNSFSSVDPTTDDDPLSINVDLEKVGRNGDGGNLNIAGKDSEGIGVFNVDVIGDEDLPNSLGRITSIAPNGSSGLATINIETAAESIGGDTFASLTVRGENTDGTDASPFGGSVNTIDASDFLGDLTIGSNVTTSAAQDVQTLTATGGGDVTFWANIDANGMYDYQTAGGDDIFVVDLDGNAVDSVGESFALNTGAGEDTVTLTGAQNVSDATTLALDNMNVDLGSDDDTMFLNTEIITKVNAGAGSDFVVIDANDSGVDGTTGSWSIGSTTENLPGSWTARVLYEATVTVNFAGFEQRLTIPTSSATNFVATQQDINAAIIAAIEANPELDRLLTTSLGDGNENTQQLTIESTVQGVNDLTVSINQPSITAASSAGTGDTSILPSEYAALEAGLLATGAVADSDVIGTATPEADLIGVFNGIDGNINEQGTATASDLVIDSADSGIAPTLAADGTNNTNATSRAIIDMATGANDLVALDSDLDSVDTVVFSDSWGKVSIVNFDAETIATTGIDEVQTIDVTGVEAGEQTVNGDLTITLGNGEVVTANIANLDGDQAISDAIVTAINGATGDLSATNAAGASTVVTITYDESLGNVAATQVDELLATDATMTQTTTGAAFTPEEVADVEVTNVTFATDAAIGDTIIFDGTTVILADTDGSGTVELDEIADQVAAGTYTNFTVTDFDNSAATVQFTAINAGADQSAVSGLAGVDMAAADFTFSGATTAATVGFTAVGTTVTAGQQGVDAAAAVAEGDDVLTFTAADFTGTLSLFVDNDGDGTTDPLQIDVALLETDSAINVGAKAATALTGALSAAWTITNNGDGTVTLAKDASLGIVASTTYTDGAVKTPIADAATIFNGQAPANVARNGDILDFTAYLDDQTSVTGSTGTPSSAVDTATSVDFVSASSNLNLESNEVVIVNDFAQDVTGSLNETWAGMDAADVDAALEGAASAYGNFINGGSTAVADPANQVGTGLSSILMVENDLNAGEYKVFAVETNAAADDGSEFTVELLGVVDFGETQTTVTANNFA